MLSSQLSHSGAIFETCEQVTVTFAPANSGDIVSKTFDVKSPLQPGSAVFLSFDEASASGGELPYFLPLQTALPTLGKVSVTVYVLIDFPDPLIIETHILIRAHDLTQCG